MVDLGDVEGRVNMIKNNVAILKNPTKFYKEKMLTHKHNFF